MTLPKQKVPQTSIHTSHNYSVNFHLSVLPSASVSERARLKINIKINTNSKSNDNTDSMFTTLSSALTL
jgi:hypothetical protein